MKKFNITAYQGGTKVSKTIEAEDKHYALQIAWSLGYEDVYMEEATTEYISRDDLLTAVHTDVAEAHNERCAQLLEAILNAPIAEVVPKTHYEVVEALARRLEKAIGEKEDKIQSLIKESDSVEVKASVETAKAIFAEIDRLVLAYMSGHILSGAFCEGIDELKKAFLESEDAKADDVYD